MEMEEEKSVTAVTVILVQSIRSRNKIHHQNTKRQKAPFTWLGIPQSLCYFLTIVKG
jgi:hypothetical protein